MWCLRSSIEFQLERRASQEKEACRQPLELQVRPESALPDFLPTLPSRPEVKGTLHLIAYDLDQGWSHGIFIGFAALLRVYASFQEYLEGQA
jgi:hypothetical protein